VQEAEPEKFNQTSSEAEPTQGKQSFYEQIWEREHPEQAKKIQEDLEKKEVERKVKLL